MCAIRGRVDPCKPITLLQRTVKRVAPTDWSWFATNGEKDFWIRGFTTCFPYIGKQSICNLRVERET
jgi:hypothetical protein